VWADELSEDAIMKGVQGGHAVVQLRGPSDPKLELVGISDGAEVRIGDTLTARRAVLEARVTGSPGGEVVIVKSGREVGRAAVDSDPWTRRFELDVAEAGDRFRAHLELDAEPAVVTGHVWATYGGAGGCSLPRRPYAGPLALAAAALLVVAQLLRRTRS
jgi:hypothetical protein